MEIANVQLTNQDAEFILQAVNSYVKQNGLPVAKRAHEIFQVFDSAFKTEEPKELEQKA